MNEAELAKRLRAGEEFVRESDALIARAFTRSDWRVEAKADGSPVTTADRGAEELLRRLIDAAFPGDGVLGEELGESPGVSGCCWVLDPIDGTASFVHGVPLFSTIVGIEWEGSPRGGIISMPGLGESVAGGAGLGAWHVRGGERRAARVSAVGSVPEAMLCTTSYDYYARTQRAGAYAAIAARFRSSRGWSDGYGALLLATGRVDAWIEPLVQRWDVSGVIPVIEEAGGRCTDWRGERRADGMTCAATNGLLHGAVMELLGGL